VNHRFALVLLAGLVTAGAAGGEPLADHDVVELEGLVPREVIERVLARRGLKPEQDLVLRGAMYSVIATANQGYRARVVIDARNGEIVGFRVVDRARGSERRADVKD
jgi:hypothetical protein